MLANRNQSTIKEIKSKEKKTIKGDMIISIAIMSSFAALTIQYFILYYFNISESGIGGQVQLLSKVIVGTLFLIALPVVLKRNMSIFISTYMVCILIILYNYWVFPQNREALKSVLFPLFFICLPCFNYSFIIDDINVLKIVMYKVSNIVFVVGTVMGYLVFTNKISIGIYSMSLSYYMLLPAIISLYKFFEKKSLKSIFGFIISLLVIIAFGSRGPIMCLGIYMLIASVENIKKLTYKSFILSFSIFLVFILGFIYFDSIIRYLYELFMDLGINSRTLIIFMEGELHLSGRDRLYDTIITKIMDNPILGIGIAGDRVLLGVYSHNIFVEFFSGFGIFVGSFLCIALIWVFFKTIKGKYKLNSNIIIWFCLGFLPLLVSSSYLIDFRFWILLGLVIREMQTARVA